MARPRKVENTQSVEAVYVETQDVVTDAVQEPVAAKVDVKALKVILFNTKLEKMQAEVVKAVQGGDELILSAVEAVLNAPNSGIASQYVQQIIQRNS